MTECANCGEPAAVSMCLPVDKDGNYVVDRSPDEVGIDPACGVCANLHAACGKDAALMNRVLELYRMGVDAVKERIATATSRG